MQQLNPSQRPDLHHQLAKRVGVLAFFWTWNQTPLRLTVPHLIPLRQHYLLRLLHSFSPAPGRPLWLCPRHPRPATLRPHSRFLEPHLPGPRIQSRQNPSVQAGQMPGIFPVLVPSRPEVLSQRPDKKPPDNGPLQPRRNLVGLKVLAQKLLL